MFESDTTKNVAGATATGCGIVLGVITYIRAQWPDLPGDAKSDAALAVFLSTALIPLISRKIAFFRDPTKKNRNANNS